MSIRTREEIFAEHYSALGSYADIKANPKHRKKIQWVETEFQQQFHQVESDTEEENEEEDTNKKQITDIKKIVPAPPPTSLSRHAQEQRDDIMRKLSHVEEMLKSTNEQREALTASVKNLENQYTIVSSIMDTTRKGVHNVLEILEERNQKRQRNV